MLLELYHTTSQFLQRNNLLFVFCTNCRKRHFCVIQMCPPTLNFGSLSDLFSSVCPYSAPTHTMCVRNCWHQPQLPLVLPVLSRHLRDVVLSALLLLSVTALWNSSDLSVSQPSAAGSCDFFHDQGAYSVIASFPEFSVASAKLIDTKPPPKSNF